MWYVSNKTIILQQYPLHPLYVNDITGPCFCYHSPENVQYWGCIYLEMWGEAWNCRSVSNICLPCSSKRLTFRYLLSSGTRSKVTSASGFEDFGTSESYIQHNYSINNKFLTLNCIRILFYLWGFLYIPEFYETESK